MRYVTALKPSTAPVWIFCNPEYVEAIKDVDSLIEYLRGYAYCGVNDQTVRTAKTRARLKVTYLPIYWSSRRTTDQIAQGIGMIGTMPTPFDHYATGRPTSMTAIVLNTVEGRGTLTETLTKGPVPIYKTVETNYAIGMDAGGPSYRCTITKVGVESMSSMGAGSTQGIGPGIKAGVYINQYQHVGSTTSSTSGLDFFISWNKTPAVFDSSSKYAKPITRAQAKNDPEIIAADPNFEVLSLSTFSVTKDLNPNTHLPVKSVMQVIGSSLVKFDTDTIALEPVGEHQVDLTVRLPIIQTAIKV